MEVCNSASELNVFMISVIKSFGPSAYKVSEVYNFLNTPIIMHCVDSEAADGIPNGGFTTRKQFKTKTTVSDIFTLTIPLGKIIIQNQ